MNELTEDLRKFAKYYEEFLRTGATGGSSVYTRLDSVLKSGRAVELASLDVDYARAIEEHSFHLDLQKPKANELELDDASEDGGDDESGAPAQGQGAADDSAEQVSDPAEEGRADDSIVASRACRAIFRKQKRDPHNRETLFGVGILGKKWGNNSVKIGPLLYWEVDLQYDAAHQVLRVFKRSPIPEINTLVFDSFLEETGDVEDLVKEIQDILSERDLSLSTIELIFRTFAGHSSDPDALLGSVENNAPARDWLKALKGGSAGYLQGAVLMNGPRSNAFLLRDLRELAAQDALPGESALAAILDRDPPPTIPELPEIPHSFTETVDGKGPLYYPLASNPSQRRVARAAESSSILTVQGPPGTGKSQTIANLVSHLMATGNSVLVTSHQRKAVEVVAKHLSPFPGMVMPLIQGDRESARQLRAQLEAILETSGPSVAKLRESVARGENALSELDRELRGLAVRFQELRTREHEMFSSVQSYSELRSVDVLHQDDEGPSGDGGRMASSLSRWCDFQLELGDRRAELESLLLPMDGETTRALEARLAGALRELIRMSSRVLDEDLPQAVRDTCDWAVGSTGDDDVATELLARLETWLGSEGRELVSGFERLRLAPGIRDELPRWVRSARSLGLERLQETEREGEELAGWFRKVSREPGRSPQISSDDIPAIQDDLEILEQRGASLWRWYLDPSVRRARERISRRAPVERATVARVCRRLRLQIDWMGRETRLESLRTRLSEQLPAFPILSPTGSNEPADLGDVIALTARQLRTLEAGPVPHLSALVQHMGSDHGPGLSLDRETLGRIHMHVSASRLELRKKAVLRALESDLPLKNEWNERLRPLLAAVDTGRRLEGDVRDLAIHLVELEALFAAFTESRDLEQDALGPISNTVEELRTQLLATGCRPDWLDRLPEVFEAHRLGSILRGSLSADPDDVTDVARGLREGGTRRLNYISELVQRRHKVRQAESLQDPACRGELLKLRKLLSKRRLTGSLIGLRGQIDYRTLLRVVPGWVCTIDDAARLFPPHAGLFDYVVIDEASQCPQTVLLPLAVRCRKLVVVGDEKQLQPTFGMFVAKAQVEALKSTHHINEHSLGLFVEGSSSLLDVANYRSSASQFLDEHFRCDPPIIAWSNERFYRNRLKILTHQREGGFTPSLQVRRVADADEDRDEKRNLVEAEAVVREIRHLVENPPLPELTLGVISPFRPQADLIQGLLEREFRSDPEKLDRHQIVASTADGFQGDERDIILYSFRQGPSSSPASLGTLERQEERFNVAFTRARRLAVSFLSAPLERFPKDGVTRSWLQHSLAVQDGKFADQSGSADTFDSQFERDVCSRLRDRGLIVTTQVPCGPFRIDLVARDADGRVLAVECDGSWKHDSFGNLRPEDYQRQDLIERAGWAVHRVSGRRFLLDPGGEFDRIVEVLSRQATRNQRELLGGHQPEQRVPLSSGSGGRSARGVVEDSADVDGVGSVPPAPAAVEKEVLASGPKADVDVDEVTRLIRWSILQSKVRGSMFDRLAEMGDRLKMDGELREADYRALNLLRDIAEQDGFDPRQDVLPD